jgi:hypothetical protein
MKETEIGGHAEGAHIHVVHLSDATTSLDLIKVYTGIQCFTSESKILKKIC